MRLTFSELRTASLERLKHFKNAQGQTAHTEPDGSDWTANDWMVALTGEVGEAANLLKKIKRGDWTLESARADLAKELADVQCYLVLLAERCGIDLEKATIQKFNEVSNRVGSTVKLGETETIFVSLDEIRLEQQKIFDDAMVDVQKLKADAKRLKSVQSKQKLIRGQEFANAQWGGIQRLIFHFRTGGRK